MSFCTCGHPRDIHTAYPVGDLDGGCARCNCSRYVAAIDPATHNIFGVTTLSNGTAVTNPMMLLCGPLAIDHVLNLAAWLIVASGVDLDRFVQAYRSILEGDGDENGR